MQSPILTLTMNPAVDISVATDRVEPERKLRCGPPRVDPGGGGVNVSRAIANLGGESVAVFTCGGSAGKRYRDLVEATGIDGQAVSVSEETRENFTIDERSTGDQYRFVLPGPRLTASEWRLCLRTVADNLPRGGYLVASGSLPPGVPTDFYGRLVHAAAGQDVRTVVDTSGPALQAALDERVYLIKPSSDELAELSGFRGEQTMDEQREAARAITSSGRASVVAVSRGAHGALLVRAEDTLFLPTPAVRVASTVGAGDSFLAGFVLGLARGDLIEEAFRTAVAAGSATAMMPASELCRAYDVSKLERDLPAATHLAL